ncbi:hypothetical protein BV210_18015 (plasmid) [Halorientalis sp. IM1011]|uniref:polysaccharide deacetylase family protein n=1 Tax=Halorientalis sp. IM1011 TaxID=1932360 RepID=UPI00097CC3A1|nr:polysaccharide deacetylase family protein [Halorientalis sp. IM1011]AQL44662.1 hypothetical protein BV210_18015 [Halorientalis sp. IM1011]
MDETGPEQSRRGVLRAIGGGVGVAMAGNGIAGSALGQTTTGNGGGSDNTSKLVFTYDDSPAEDVTKTLPIHQEEGVPASIGAVSSHINHSEEWLSGQQLQKLESEGWEIMSHTAEHRALDEIEVTRDVAPGDTKLYVESNIHSRTPDPILISDGETETTATIVDGGEDANGEYLELESSVGQSFSASDGVTERFTDEVLRSALENSKTALEQYGVTVSNLVLPYDRYGERAKELIPEYYDAVPNADYGGVNHVDDLDPYEMERKYFAMGRSGVTELGDFMDTVADENAIGILAGHSQSEELTPDRIRLAIRMAKERDIEIVTLREALQDAGVVDESNTSTSESTGPSGDDSTGSSDSSGGFFDSLAQTISNIIDSVLSVF